MKRFFSFMMALVLVLSLSVTAFAAEDTGSITITNATIGQTYAPYKIFDASISGGEDSGFIYSITEDNQFFDDMFGADGKTAKDYCTLFTCTPYGINTHRLIVRGIRIETIAEKPVLYVANEAFRMSLFIPFSICATYCTLSIQSPRPPLLDCPRLCGQHKKDPW